MIEKGAKLVTTGTSTDPIIFTSDESLAPRALGDWGGIVFDGPASNNNSNSLTIRLSSTYTITGDDINDADNSGSFQFVQVHFGDAGYSTDVLSKISAYPEFRRNSYNYRPCADHQLEV